MIRSIVRKIKANSAVVVGSATVVGTSLIGATNALAVGVADAGVTTAFSGMGDNIVATMWAVAPFAVGIMAAFLGFKYGKKIFKIVASS